MNQTNNRIREEIINKLQNEWGVDNRESDSFDNWVADLLLSKIDELLKSQREEIAKQFIEIEKDKWKDAEHCTCLGYAIVKIFGKKYERIIDDYQKLIKEG